MLLIYINALKQIRLPTSLYTSSPFLNCNKSTMLFLQALCPKLFVTIFRNLVKFGDYISKFGQIWKIAKWIIQIGKFIYDKIN